MHNYSICMQNCFLSCFNRGFFTNQVTNLLTEVVPFCKSVDKCYVRVYQVKVEVKDYFKQQQFFQDSSLLDK